jgi:hypothetical protein
MLAAIFSFYAANLRLGTARAIIANRHVDAAVNVSGARKVWIESIPLLATGPKGRGK